MNILRALRDIADRVAREAVTNGPVMVIVEPNGHVSIMSATSRSAAVLHERDPDRVAGVYTWQTTAAEITRDIVHAFDCVQGGS